MTDYYMPLGDQGAANSTTSGIQTRPQAASLASGGYVVVWEDASGSPDDSSVAIRAQMFDSEGARLGDEFLVNTIVAGDQTHPSVAALPGGGFLVTWTGTDSSGSGIKGQLYTAAGAKSGDEFLVNTKTAGNQAEARVIDSFGEYAVVWLDHSATGTAIRGQLFTQAGAKSGGEFLVAAESSQARSDLDIARVNDGSNDGRLIVTWTQANGDGSGNAVMVQVVNYYREPYLTAFPVSQTQAGNQQDAAVAAYHHPKSDGFIVAYVDSADSGGAGAITVRIFDAKGKPTGDDLRLTQPGSGARDPSVIAFESGLFAVSWTDSAGGLKVQIVNATGETLGEPLEIGSAGALATLIALGEESFVAAWADGDIQTRAFGPAGPAVADLAISDTKVSEAVPANVTVAELGATGIGGSGGFSYALIEDSSGGAFTLEGNRLVLADPSRLDFETAPEVQLTVRVTDSDGLTREETFTLEVADAAVEPQGWTAGDRFDVKDAPYGANQGSAASLATGGFVMVYLSTNVTDPVRGQIFSDSGEKVGAEFVLASEFNGGQPPQVAALADGGFAVLYTASSGVQGTPLHLFTQLFDSDGQAVGDRVRIGTGEGGQTGAIAALPEGGFVVTYSNAWYTVQGGDTNLFGQLFDSDGDADGAAFRVATGFEAGSVSETDVAVLADGTFVVTWQLSGSYIVYGQRLAADGTRLGSTFRVDAAGDPNLAVDPSVAGLAGGGFVISWSERIPYQPGETDGWSVKAQMFSSAGAKVGGEFVVHSSAVAEQQQSSVTPLAGGGFMVVWNEHVSRPSVGDSDWIGGITRAQMFDSLGNKVGGEFALDEGFAQPQYYPAVATLSWGGVLVLYDDLEGSAGTQARLLSPGTFDARDDSIVAYEKSGAAGTLFADNGAGADEAPANGALAIAEVNGSSASVGETITLESGALLTVNADGTFDYDTNHMFDALADFGSGGSNRMGSDSFTYRLAGGDTATVNLVIRGEYSAPHVIQGTAGADILTGAAGPDSLMLQLGGEDVVNAGGGNDNIFFGGSLDSADIVNGGDGGDVLVLQGSYAGGLLLGTNVTQIEGVSILGGNNTFFGESGTNRYDYVLTTSDVNFAAGLQVRVNGAALLADEDFTFNGSAESDASFVVYGGKGKDTLTGGLGNDIFFYAEERFSSGDTVNGGSGYDGMFLRGNYTIDFNAPGYTGLFTSIENLTLTSATDVRYARGGGTEFDYNLTLSNVLVGSGQVLTVSGALLMATETMILDGSLESDGVLRLFGGKAADTLKGGSLADILHGNQGADQLAGNGGADTFRYDNIAESNSANMDQILDFNPGTDKIELTRVDANSLVAGNQAFSWIGSNAFSGSAGQLRAFQSGSNWIVEGDVNGDSIADLVISLTLQGPTPLGAGDFLL